MLVRIQKILRAKGFRILAGLTLAYLAFSYLAVDPIAKRVLPWVAEKKLASRISVGHVKFDPFTLALTVDNLRLTTMGGAPLAGFDRLYLDLEASGLFRFAWHLDDIRLTAPQAVLEVAPDGKLNWADLIAKVNEDKTKSDGMPRLLIDHILIEKGNIKYSDSNRKSPYSVELKPLGIELNGLSTLPEDRGEYSIVANLPDQGGTLKWKGDLGLNPVASKGNVAIDGVHLAKLAQIIDAHSLPVELTHGQLQTSFGYSFAMSKDGAEPKPVGKVDKFVFRLDEVAGTLPTKDNSRTGFAVHDFGVSIPTLDFSLLNQFQLTLKGMDVDFNGLSLNHNETALMKLDAIDVKGIDFDLQSRKLNVGTVVLKDGEINASRNQTGVIDWQQALSFFASEKQTSEQEPSAPAKDSTSPKEFVFTVPSIELQHWKVSFHDQKFTHPLTVEIKDFNLGLGLSNADGDIKVSGIGTQISNMSLVSSLYPSPAANLARFELANGQFDLKKNSLDIDSVALSGLQAQIVRDANNPFNWQSILQQTPDQQSGTKPVTEAKPATTAAIKWTLGKLSLGDSSLHIEDNTNTKPVALDIQSITAELLKASSQMSNVIPIKAGFKVYQGGQFDLNGKLALQPMKAELQLKLDKFSLKPFAPYVNHFALLKLKDGSVSVNGKFAMKSDKAFSGQFRGGFSVDNLAINEEDTDTTFLGWKSVSSDSLNLGLGPNKLHMDELRIIEPNGKFIIYEDKSLNIKRILRSPETADSTKPATPATPVSVKPQDNDAFPVDIERLSITNAELEFADLSLTPQFGTHINSLSGVVNGLSSNPSSTAQVELDGKVDEYGSAKIRGSIQPFNATDFTDLQLSFQNLEMNRLTPYSGKFAGRKIDSGKLSVDLQYKIKNRQLAGENKFVLNKLVLGERVDSPDAMNLPLDLAIALLEDSDGVIDMDLPISGSLDDPQFSYGRIIWKAILNVLGKIVTSPFHVLGKLLGVSDEKFAAIEFDPGLAALAPQEQEKLKTLAAGMAKRPSIGLNIVPAFDPVADKSAIQETTTRRDILKEMGLNISEDERPGPVDINNVKVQSAIEVLLKERSGGGRDPKVLNKLKDMFKKSKPEDAPKYTQMLEQLKATVNVSDEDMVKLASERGLAIQNYLVEKASMDPSHVHVADPVKITADGKSVSVKMELGVSKK